MKNNTHEINEGWEAYYKSSEQGTLWKDDFESFLIDNIETMTAGLEGYSVLDVGCGDGRNLWPWMKSAKNICCLDVAESGLKKIAEKCNTLGMTTPTLVCDDLLKTNLMTNTFDVVQSFDALEHISDAKEAISKLCSMAKPNGYIIFNYLTPNDCSYGEGDKLDEQTYLYKDTIFKFLTEQDIKEILPHNIKIISSQTKKWDDPPHGDYRPYPHIHEAAFFLLRRTF